MQRFSRAEAGEEVGRAEVVVMVRVRRRVRRWGVRKTMMVLMLEVLVGCWLESGMVEGIVARWLM